MAVVIETTLGDITVDLYLDQRPVTCLNFLKLCKMKYYNFNLFHSIRSGFIAQTGDPSGEGSGGQSIFGLLEGPTKRFFSGEKMPKIRHTNAGLLSMVCTDDMMVGSQFFFTLAPELDSLDGVHCVIGEVTEGHEVLRKLNEVICDDGHRPYQDVRITHTVVLEDPFNDPAGFRAPSRSPSPSAERLKGGRIAPDEEIDETQGKSAAEVQEIIEEKEAKARATILEIVGDLPDADIAPPENVLFVCKLNPVTTDEDLEIIFSRFGKIVSCEVIRDKKSGDSLQYAFIEFSDKKSCEEAYFKMDNVLIDDRRIHVDFSQSVSKMRWLGKGRGVKYLNDNDTDYNNYDNSKSKKLRSRDRKNSNNDHYNNKTSKDRYESRQNHNDREKRHRSDRDTRKDRERSRSRSRHVHRDSNNDNRKYVNSNNSKAKEKYGDERNNLNRDHKSRSNYSPIRNQLETRKSPNKVRGKTETNKRENDDLYNKEKHMHLDKRQYSEHSEYKPKRNEANLQSHRDGNKKEYIKQTENKLKRKEIDESSESLYAEKKRHKHDKNDEPLTPSPTAMKSRKKDSNKTNMKKNRNTKKKREPSTSSSSDTSDSSTSSSESSSSEEDRKKQKKNIKRHRKKHSSSSSSETSDSSTSSSSTDSSSDSSTSSSDSEPRRKKRNNSKKINKKSKKK